MSLARNLSKFKPSSSGLVETTDIADDAVTTAKVNPAQTDITSVGTLTSATISGALSAKGGAVFNEDSADVDFRIESNGNANIFVVDGGNDRVGIGGSPAFATEIQTSSTDTSLTAIGASQLVVTNTGTPTTNQSAKVALRLADGSLNGNSFIAGVRESNSSRAMAMVFATAQTSDGDPDERVRIASGGDVTLTGGNLVIGTGGKGIDFSSATAPTDGSGNNPAETSTATLLDDYEEGTFIPISNSVDNQASGSTIKGMYVKVGNMVTISVRFTADNESTNGHQFGVHLPIRAGTTESSGSFNTWFGQGAFTTANGNGADRVWELGGDGNYVNIKQQGASSTGEITGNSMTGTFNMSFSITYQTKS